jgi:DNA-binding NarL/FixJ family response regulator
MGQTQKQIARDLGVDVSTVGSLFHDVFRKLGAWNMAHAVHLACEVGILPKSPLVDLPNALSDVLRLVAEGRTNAEIAEMLGRPVYTVVDQVKEARRRLGARDRAHAAALAVALNLVRVDVRPFLTPESVDAA